MSAHDACQTAAEAILATQPEAQATVCPLSDGGEGLVNCIEQRLPVHRIYMTAHDPLMNPIEAYYVVSDNRKTAYMEMAATGGLPLVPPDRRNPMLTTTYGVGEMIVDAIRQGAEHIFMGIGGSATCDGGRGMIQAIRDLGLTPKECDIRITVACDVDNPLYGPNGAAFVFAPQKGATPSQVQELDERLRLFAQETEDAGIATPDLATRPGTGAAGGLGYGLLTYLNAELKSGIDILLDIAQFNSLIADADVVITGEGKSDHQTLMGKVPHGVLRRVKLQNATSGTKIKVWLLSGAIDDEQGNLADSFDIVRSINEHDIRPLEILLEPKTAKNNLFRTIQMLK